MKSKVWHILEQSYRQKGSPHPSDETKSTAHFYNNQGYEGAHHSRVKWTQGK